MGREKLVKRRGVFSGLVERIPARTVAHLLGVKVGTLSKWRRLGKGPKGWLRVSQTLIVYQVTEIEKFLREREEPQEGR